MPDLADEDTAGSKYEGDTVISDEKSFLRQVSRPDMQTDDISKIIGLQVRNFPTTLSEDEVVNFLKEKVDDKITRDAISFMKYENSLSAAIEGGLEGVKVVAATKDIDFKESKKKFFGKPLYCRILKNLTPVKVDPPLGPPPQSTQDEGYGPSKNLQLSKIASKPSVKEQTDAIEGKGDEKKLKPKIINQKIAEFGLTNTTAQNIKRNHKEVGSPTSPEIKKSPKKSKAGDKQTKH